MSQGTSLRTIGVLSVGALVFFGLVFSGRGAALIARAEDPAVVLGATASGRDTPPPSVPDDVTFAEHVAPILYRSCTECHRPGGSGPFSLVSFDDAREHATKIVRATRSGLMPPWLPASDGRTFVGERYLPDHEKEILSRWVDVGAPAGDLALAPDPPPAAEGWQLGEPDLVVQVPTYTLPAQGRDVYRNIVVQVPIDEPRYVTSVELRPGDPRVVHHARMMIDTTDSSAALDRQDGAPGFDGMELRSNASNPDGHFLGWTPGKGALPPLENMAWRLDPGTDLVLQLHMRTTGSEEQVESEVGFYFVDQEPTEAPVLLLLSSLMIDIPAGDPDYRVTNSYELPVDVDLLSIYPHAHYLGKDLRGFATLPGGATRELIRVPDWDFNWQDDYRFVEPVYLPAGTVLTLDFQFDNSAANPHNPSDPPRRVVYGSNSTDEMADLILQVLPRDPSSRAELVAHATWQNEVEDMAYLAAQELSLGHSRLEAGDADQAIVHFREAMQYQIDHPAALTGLARAMALKGDFDAAVVVGERAVQVTQRNDAAALASLADALAGVQDPRAVDVAEEALSLATQRGETTIADRIQERLPAYRRIRR